MKTKNKKMALFGGSFNPIQNSHIKIIKTILSKKLVEEIWIIPCKNHAFSKNLASTKHRINMIKIAIKNLKNVKINKTEINSKTTNYTLNTLKKLQKKYPKYDFYWTIGSDVLHEIKRWHKYQELLKQTEFIVSKRKNYSIKKQKNLKIFSLINLNEPISSTEIRERIKSGKALKNLIPSKIIRYIKENQLYLNKEGAK